MAKGKSIPTVTHATLSTKTPMLNFAEVHSVLPPQSPRSQGKKTLVLDLDETLVHSSFKPPNEENCIILQVEIEDKRFKVYVLVRPGAVEFLIEM